MKKGLFALNGVLLVFTFAFMGCTTTTGGGEEQTTKIEGTWKHQMTELNAVYVFTGNNWSFTASAPDQYNIPKGPLSGTFTFDDTSITFTATGGGSDSWTQPYTFKTINNKEGVNLSSSTSGNMLTRLIGDFIKQ
jgi:hypothetical protein